MLAPVLTYRNCTGTDWQEGVWITNLALEVTSGLLLVVYLWVSAGEATELAGLTSKAALLKVGRYLKRKAARKASLMKAQILQFWGPYVAIMFYLLGGTMLKEAEQRHGYARGACTPILYLHTRGPRFRDTVRKNRTT